jgi:hypothetical protein
MGLNKSIPATTETRSPISERLLLPIRLGGDGFISAWETRIPAYIGSLALSATIVRKIAPFLMTEALTERYWPSLQQFHDGFHQVKSNPHLKLEDRFDINDIWRQPVHKFQAHLARAVNARRKEKLWTTVPKGRPHSGPVMVGALSSSQFARRQQAIANVDSSTSAWL